MEYGLIGGRLGHSYSKPIHEALAGYDYRLCPLPTPEEAHAFMRARDFKAINVTIPYKELVMPYCDVIDDAGPGHRLGEHHRQQKRTAGGPQYRFCGLYLSAAAERHFTAGKNRDAAGYGRHTEDRAGCGKGRGGGAGRARQPPQSRERHHLRGGRAARGRAGDRKHQPRGHVSEQRRMPCGAGELPTAGSCA